MEITNNKLETCEVCAAERAKYTCPKCEVRTCDLSCINIHKKELNCDGIRDKTKFIPLNVFTDLDLLSDYRLLEDIGRSVEQFQKNLFVRPDQLPVHLQRLKSAAYTRGINLEYLPRNFSRHQDNTSFLNWKTDEFSWRVELIFPQAENTKWVIENVPDTSRLSVLLEDIFYSEPELKNDESCNRLSILQNKLKYYRACGLTGVKALLKAEKVKKSDSRFYELEFDQSLRENLKNKTIIEFPIIYVVLKDHSSLFEIVDSDEEEIKEIPTRKWTNKKVNSGFKRRPMKNHESPKEKEVNSSVNYFFNTEISDSDDEEVLKTNFQAKNRNKELAIPDYHDLVKM